MKIIYLTLIKLLIKFLIFHVVRDFMQLLGFHNLFTEIAHVKGINNSNKILGLVGLSYKRWTEIPMILFELIIIVSLFKYQK